MRRAERLIPWQKSVQASDGYKGTGLIRDREKTVSSTPPRDTGTVNSLVSLCYCRLRVALFHVHETLDYFICVRVASALNLKSALSFCHYAYGINFADLILQQQNTENNARPALPETASNVH